MPDDLDLATNLITRVNVGRRAHPHRRADARPRWPSSTATGAGPTPSSTSWVNRVANALSDRGYARGDALALASGNSCEFLVTYFACAKLGLVCVPMNLGWRPDEIAYVLDHSESRGLVVEAQLLAQVLPGVEKVPAVADLFVAPGTGASYDESLPDRTWLPFDAPGRGDGRARALRRRPRRRSATCTRAAPRPSPRAWSAATPPSTSSR